MDSKGLKTIFKELNISDRYYSINSNTASDRYIFCRIHIYWECFCIDEWR